MSTDLTTRTDHEITGISSNDGFELLQRVAKMFAASSLVPKDFQNNVANCSIAAHMAMRMKADPLMVMQNLYVVHGRPGWSSQFLIATFNQCGRFSAMRYEFTENVKLGSPEYGCRAWAIEKETNERLNGTWITMAMAKKEGWSEKAGSKWKTMPEQMLKYRAAAFFVRTHAPEIAMGLPSADEVDDMQSTPAVKPVDNTAETIVIPEEGSKSDKVAAAMAAAKARQTQDPGVESDPGADTNPQGEPDADAVFERFRERIAAAKDDNELTLIFEDVERSGLSQSDEDELHRAAIARQEALAVPA